MEVLFGSDASVRGPAAVPFSHVDEVCVSCHPKFEFLNELIVEHVIFWFVQTFVIYIVHILQDRGKGIAHDSTQPRSSPTHDTPIDEVLVIYVQIVCIFMFKLFAYLCSNYHLHVQIVILKFKL